MDDLYQRVIHHIEGEEEHQFEASGFEGTKTYTVTSFGPGRWIERVAGRGKMTALDFLAIILFEIDDFSIDRRRCVELWAGEVLDAVESKRLTPRDVDSFLPLRGDVVTGWDWLVEIDEAQEFLCALGMDWRLDDVIKHLEEQVPCLRDLIAMAATESDAGAHSLVLQEQGREVSARTYTCTEILKRQREIVRELGTTYGATKKLSVETGIGERKLRHMLSAAREDEEGAAIAEARPSLKSSN